MAEFPALPLWTDAYLGDTQHLTLEEHGAYLKLLMCMWRSNACALLDDDLKHARILGISLKRWKTLRPTIEEFFYVEDGLWKQKRLTKERRYVEKMKGEKSARARHAAQVRWLKNNKTDMPQAMPEDMPEQCLSDATHTHTHTQVKKDSSLRSESKENSPNGLDPPDEPLGENLPLDPLGVTKRKDRTHGKRATPLDPTWRANDQHRALGAELGVSVHFEADQFRDHAAQKGRTTKDWDAAFRMWLRKAAKDAGGGAGISGGGQARGGRSEPASVVAAVREVTGGG